MSSRRFGPVRVVLAAAFFILVLAAPARGQGAPDDETPFYDVPVLPTKSPWLQWLVGSAFVAGCVLIALKNPHRTHLD